MNIYCGIRSLRPARLFSFRLLDEETAGSPSRRRAQTWRSLFIAPCALREASGNGRVLARLGRAGEIAGFGFSKTQPPHHSAEPANVTLVIPRVADLATAFTDKPS